MDIGKLLKAKQAWSTFCAAHPRFPDFLKAVQAKGIHEGTEILISITSPDGEVIKSGIRIKPSDLELIDLLRSLQ